MTASTFACKSYAPDLPGGLADGQLHISANGLRFVAHNPSLPALELPLEGLDLRLGGAMDHMIFFSHPSHPDVSLHTEDQGVLAHPALAQLPALVAKTKAVRRKKNWIRYGVYGFGGAVALVVLALVLSWGLLIGWLVDRIPPALEIQLGEVVFSQVQIQYDFLEGDDLEGELDRLAAPLLETLPDTGYPFDLHLVDDPTLNAFAVPGGHIVVHSGLIEAAETPEEVLGVLGHELAHVTERHSLRQMVGSAGLFVVVQALLGDASGLAAVLVDGSTELLSLSFSRDHELEADRVGWQYLLEAGIDPRGMIDFFETLEEETGDDMSGALSFLSTHPATDDRIETLHRELEALPSMDYRSLEVDFEAFQERVRRASGASL